VGRVFVLFQKWEVCVFALLRVFLLFVDLFHCCLGWGWFVLTPLVFDYIFSFFGLSIVSLITLVMEIV
jgi:hypothetical protein